MFKLLLALIIIVPAMEIGLLIVAGNVIGTIPTVLLIISTGVIGAWLAKKQGLRAIGQVQQQIQNGQMPGEVIVDGLCILVGGVLLLTPGFITDTIGFILLFPGGRKLVKPYIFNMIRSMMNRNTITYIRR
ncbi:FxsA family protein [Bacillus sp. DJP31]|uniref:FxsA family protein n=1 Tax=Bacillus sp. DJP31 TaxID=3409789 RepID=UPI003BB4D878